MGYVIQQIGLFPHMTIRQNIGLVSRIEKKKDTEDRIRYLLNLVGLWVGLLAVLLDGAFVLAEHWLQRWSGA